MHPSRHDLPAHQARQQQVASGAEPVILERKGLELLDDGPTAPLNVPKRPCGGSGTGYCFISFQSPRGIFDPFRMLCAVLATNGPLDSTKRTRQPSSSAERKLKSPRAARGGSRGGSGKPRPASPQRLSTPRSWGSGRVSTRRPPLA